MISRITPAILARQDALPLTENPLFEGFFNSVQEAGYPLTDDVNGYQQEGFGKFDQTIHNSRRRKSFAVEERSTHLSYCRYQALEMQST